MERENAEGERACEWDFNDVEFEQGNGPEVKGGVSWMGGRRLCVMLNFSKKEGRKPPPKAGHTGL